MKTRTAVAVTLILIPVIWFVSGHRLSRDKAPDFRDALRDNSAAEVIDSAEFGKVSSNPAPDFPNPQAADASGDKAQADKFIKYLNGKIYEWNLDIRQWLSHLSFV